MTLPFEPTPFPHSEGEFCVLTWTETEAFFKELGNLVGRTIERVTSDSPEPGCLRFDFSDGGGAILSFVDIPAADVERARHLALVRGWKNLDV